MKIFKKVTVGVLTLLFAIGLVKPTAVSAATTPNLGTAKTYGILGNLFQHNIAATTITGDPANAPTVGVLGYSSEAGVGAVVVVNGTTNVANAAWTAAGVAQGLALSNLNGQLCVSIGAIVDLAAYDTDGPGGLAPGTFPPGCYSSTGAMNILGGGTVTLLGAGTYIFKPDGALGTSAGSIVALSGASACDVFWVPTAATTLGANSTFVGTIIDPSGVTMSNLAAVNGRILAYGGTVTADSNDVDVPVCATSGGGSQQPVQLPFPLINITKIPSPLALPSGPGSVTYTYVLTNIGLTPVGAIEVTDDKCSSVQRVSGDTNGDSLLDLTEVWTYTCTQTVSQTVTNIVTARGSANGGTIYDRAEAVVVVGDDIIPPLIHLEKRPNVFVLPAGGGAVTYSYLVTNPGTEPLHDVTITDDKCTGLPGRVVGHPGDLNDNNLLESNEVWQFRCQTNLTQTTTNVGTAQGSANGFTVTDTSLATVVVAAPSLPSTGVPDDGIGTWLLLVLSSFASGSLITHMFWRQRSVGTVA